MRKRSQAGVRSWLAVLTAAILPVTTLAQELPSQPVTGSPFIVPPVFSDTRPTALAAGRILILPFVAVNPADSQPWIGKSVQQSLVADLLVASPARVGTADDTPTTIEQAIALGRRANARYVVLGNFVSNAQELRITGQIVDVETGRPVSGIKATGTPDQIFRMEDALAFQVKAAAMPETLTATDQARQQNTPAAEPAAQPAPAQYTGIRNDAVGAASPTAPYYSPYATIVDNNSFPAEADRYYYSNPTVNNYYYDNYYSASPYGIGAWDYPYVYGSPFLGLNVGSGYGHYGHGGSWGHGSIGGGRNLHQPRRSVVIGNNDFGFAGTSSIDYSGIVNGKLTNPGQNRAIVPTYGGSHPVISTGVTSDPPGSIRARTMRLEFSSPPRPAAVSNNGARPRAFQGIDSNRIVEIGGNSGITENAGNYAVAASSDARSAGNANARAAGNANAGAAGVVTSGNGVIRSAPGGTGQMNFVPPPESAPPPVFAPASPPAAVPAPTPAPQQAPAPSRGNNGAGTRARGGTAGGRR